MVVIMKLVKPWTIDTSLHLLVNSCSLLNIDCFVLVAKFVELLILLCFVHLNTHFFVSIILALFDIVYIMLPYLYTPVYVCSKPMIK